MSKILFILKRRENYSEKVDTKVGMTTGLYNSASFVSRMLNKIDIESVMEVAIDNNCIDRLVTKHNPDYVIIEALWVVPSKFTVLCKLHSNVKWIIRIHSEMPFMAGEGMAMNWLGDYSHFDNILIGVNAPRMLREIRTYLQSVNNWSDSEAMKKVFYLPNYYPQKFSSPRKIDKSKDYIDVGCFGAVRPLKNHMVQAVAALDFANREGKKLHFHINAGRIEMKGQPVLHNLQAFFTHLYSAGHRLIRHDWQPHEDFLHTCAEMDIGMQCNFSETFNIVGADLTSEGIPLIGTTEIPWLASGRADPTDSKDISRALSRAYHWPALNVRLNQFSLHKYTNKTAEIWYKEFK